MDREEGLPHRKRSRRWAGYLLSLPVLSISVVAVVLALPVIGTSFVLFDDGNLKVEGQVEKFLRRSAAQGFVEGRVIVENGYDFDILLLSLQLTIVSGRLEVDTVFSSDVPPARINLRFPSHGLSALIPAGGSFQGQFSGTVSGDLSALSPDSDFQVFGEVVWAEVHSDGTITTFTQKIGLVCVGVGNHVFSSNLGFESCQAL